MIYVSGPSISAYLKNRLIFCYRALFFVDTVLAYAIAAHKTNVEDPELLFRIRDF